MALKDTVNSIVMNTTEIVKAVEEMGGTYDDNPKNLANTPDAIRTITGGGGWDPSNPTLDGLQDAINKGTPIDPGTVIPDTYNGQSNPLIVVAYLDGTNSAYKDTSGNNITGVILQRSFVTDKGQRWDNSNNNYATSEVNTFLNGTYLSRCSAELQSMISDVKIATAVSSGATTVSAKVFLPSIEEVYGDASANNAPGIGKEGSYFPYWKTKTGLSSPSNSANSGRIVTENSASGNATSSWLRSRYTTNTSSAWIMDSNGSLSTGAGYYSSCGVLPCFVVAKKA